MDRHRAGPKQGVKIMKTQKRKVRRYCARCGFNPAQVVVIRTSGKSLVRMAKAWRRG